MGELIKFRKRRGDPDEVTIYVIGAPMGRIYRDEYLYRWRVELPGRPLSRHASLEEAKTYVLEWKP